MTKIKLSARRSVSLISNRRVSSPVFKQAGISLRGGSSDQSVGGLQGFLNKLIGWSMTGVFFLVPIFLTGTLAQGASFEKMILFYFLTLIGASAWIVKSIMANTFKFKRTPLDWPIFSFLVVMVISTFSSIGVKDSLVGGYGLMPKSLSAVVIFILFYYLVVNNIDQKRIKCFFGALIVSSSLILIHSALQLFGIYILPLEFTKVSSFNFVGSLSGLAIFAGVLLPILLLVKMKAKEITSSPKMCTALRIFVGLTMVVDLLILTILNGFVLWPLLIASFVLILALIGFKVIRIKKKCIALPIGFLIVSIVFLLLGKYDFASKLGIVALPAEVSLTKAASWDIAKDSLAENKFFGSGPATYYYGFNKFKGTGFNETELWNIRFDNASVVYFEVLSVSGVVGLVAFLVLIVLALVNSFLSVLRTKEDEESHVIMLGLSFGLLSLVTYAGFFGFNAFLIIFSVLMAVLTVAYAVYLRNEDKSEVNTSFKASNGIKVMFAIVGMLILALLINGSGMVIADYYARKSITVSDVSKKIEYLEKAIKFAPYQDTYYVALSNHYVALANESLVAVDTKAANDTLSKGIKAGEKAVSLAPAKSDNYESLALIYENAYYYKADALTFAEESYKKVIELEPGSPTPYLRLALINMARVKLENSQEEKIFFISEAIKLYDESIKRKVNLASAHYGKSIAQETLGDLDGAIQSLTNATIINQNASFMFELGRLYFNRGVLAPVLTQGDDAVEDLVNSGDKSSSKEDDLSVNPGNKEIGTVANNQDLATAEQLFLSILLNNQNHANARYSLALLYDKTGDKEKAGIMVKSLMKMLEDDEQKEQLKEQFPGLY
ncbi:hypothetical protein ISS03_02585 [Patescibacteria group bacterium]|nr:hypothetical protein [Patescibacteria group bacterium]